LANLEVICQRIIFTTTKNSMLDRTLTTPNVEEEFALVTTHNTKKKQMLKNG